MAGEKTRKVGKGMGEMSEATTGDGGGTKKERKEIGIHATRGILQLFSGGCAYLFCSLAVVDPRVGHTMDVLSPFIPVLCHSD